jgi:hypothetical protein
MRYHAEQQRLWSSQARFRVVPAGRQSGKTELAKRFLALRAMTWTQPDGWFVAAAPTHLQAKRIYWRDLKRLIPASLVWQVSESELSMLLWTGTIVQVIGMDVPERIEGPKLSGIVLDEYGNMKPDVWEAHIRASLTHHRGWAWFIGVPEGRNHYYDLYCQARADHATWDAFHWKSADIIPADELEEARSRLDPVIFDQEYNASFVTFAGQAYHCFDERTHANKYLPYNPHKDLIFCFDFNVKPGTASIVQQHGDKTFVIGEVWIPDNSNTPMVVRTLLENEDWRKHKGRILCYGDATGGARGTAKTKGSDWDIIRSMLQHHYKRQIGIRVPRSNPAERARVNAVNARLMNASGKVSLYICPASAPNTVKDFEGVRVVEGSAGEIDKKTDPMLTHLTDGIGYYIQKRFPIHGMGETRQVA